METSNTFISCPILLYRRAGTFLDFITVNSAQWAWLAFEFWLVVVSVIRTFGALVVFEEREIFWTWGAFLDFDVVDLLVWAIFASFVWKIKEFGVETSKALFSSEIFFFRRAFALFWLLIVNLLEGTFWTVFNRNVEVSVVSWALWAFFVNENWCTFWASPALIFINVIHMIFGTWLAFFGCIVKVVREVTCDAGFWCFKGQRFWALAFLRFRVELFIEWALVTAFVFFVKEIRQGTGNAFAVCFKRRIWIAETFFASDVVWWSWFARLTVESDIVPLRINWTRCAIFAIEEGIFVRTRGALLGVNVINLSFWTVHTCESSKIKISGVNAQNTGFIVPKVSFFVSTLTFHLLNVEGLLIWAFLTFFCVIIINLAVVTFVTDRIFEEEWFVFRTDTLLIQTWKDKICLAFNRLAFEWSCTEVEALFADETLLFGSVKISWDFALNALILCWEEWFIARTFCYDIWSKYLLTFFGLRYEDSTLRAGRATFWSAVEKLVCVAVNAVCAIEVWQIGGTFAWFGGWVVNLIWFAFTFGWSCIQECWFRAGCCWLAMGDTVAIF